MPAVTLPASPSGLPIATTSCPTLQPRRVAELHRRRHGPAGAQHRQVGQRVAADHVDDGLRAVGEDRLGARRRRPTTCALVSSTPSVAMTVALPAPPPRDVRTAMLATLGSTVAATATTVRE